MTLAELMAPGPIPERLAKAARIDIIKPDGTLSVSMFRNVDGALDPVPRGVWGDA